MPRGKKNKQATAKGPTASNLKSKESNTVNTSAASETLTADTSELKQRLVNAQAKLSIINDRLAAIQPIDLSHCINNENISAITAATIQTEKQTINSQNVNKTETITVDKNSVVSQEIANRSGNGSIAGSRGESEKSKKKRNRNRKKKVETSSIDGIAEVENVSESDPELTEPTVDNGIISAKLEIPADNSQLVVQPAANTSTAKTSKNDAKQKKKKETPEPPSKIKEEVATISIEPCEKINANTEPILVIDSPSSALNKPPSEAQSTNINSQSKKISEQPTSKKAKNKHNKKNESLKNIVDEKSITETKQSSSSLETFKENHEIEKEIKVLNASSDIELKCSSSTGSKETAVLKKTAECPPATASKESAGWEKKAKCSATTVPKELAVSEQTAECSASTAPKESVVVERKAEYLASSTSKGSVELEKNAEITKGSQHAKCNETKAVKEDTELQSEAKEESICGKETIEKQCVPSKTDLIASNDDKVPTLGQPIETGSKKNANKKNRRGLKQNENVKQVSQNDSLAGILNAAKLEIAQTKIKGNEVEEKSSKLTKEILPTDNKQESDTAATIKPTIINLNANDLKSVTNPKDIEPTNTVNVEEAIKPLEYQQKEQLMQISAKVKEEIKIIQEKVDPSKTVQLPLLPEPKKIQQPKKIEAKLNEPIKPIETKEIEADKNIVDGTAKIWQILMEANQSTNPVEIQMDDETLLTTPSVNKLVEISSQKELIDKNNHKTEADDQLSSVISKLSAIEEERKQISYSQDTSALSANVTTMPANENKEEVKTRDASAEEGSSTAFHDNNIYGDSTHTGNDKKLGAQSSKNKRKNKKIDKPTQIVHNKSAAPPVPSEPPISVPPPETEVPLDISIISEYNLDLSDDIKGSLSDLPNVNVDSELLTGSKNVQGSDFVQSVKTEAKSLEIKTTAMNEIKTSIEENVIKCDSNTLPNHSTSVNEVKKNDLQNEKDNEDKKTKDKLIAPTEDIIVACAKSACKTVETNLSINCVKQVLLPNSEQKQFGSVSKSTAPTASSTTEAKNKPNVPPKPNHLKASVNVVNSAGDNKKTTKKPRQSASDEEEEYFEYKFTPRQVFISTICQTCKDPLTINRHLCKLCQMVSYCSAEHLNSDETDHKQLCAAIQETAKKRGGHVYNNSRILNHNDYRSLRVHTLNICENFLRRSLQTFEREILLFPRLCSQPTCREWRQNLLKECNICQQATYCEAYPDHLPNTHHKWCKAFDLYQKLVIKQKQNGRIEVDLPSKVMTKPYLLPNDINDIFKDLYKNLTYIQDECMYVTLTQLATAPLTAFFAAQTCNQFMKDAYTIHLVGAELQFEAEVLDKWETFFLHLAPNINELRIVFIGPELNAENLPLEILSRIRMCRLCRQSCRVAKFDFQCGKLYTDYVQSTAFVKPDLVCFFNAGLYRTTGFNGTDTWPASIKAATNMNCPILVTSYTELESPRDLERLQLEADRSLEIVQPPQVNSFSSQRPERNFISDEIAPMIFKNYYVFIVK